MRDTTAAATGSDLAEAPGGPGDEGVPPDARAAGEVAPAARRRARRGARLILPVVAAAGAAALATALAIALTRARQANPASAPAPTLRGPRTAPASTINVNWGFALFGTNVIAARGLPAWRLRRLLPLVAARLRRR